MVTILKEEYDKIRKALGHNVKKTLAREDENYAIREGYCHHCNLNIRILKEKLVASPNLRIEVFVLDSLEFSRNRKISFLASELDQHIEQFAKHDSKMNVNEVDGLSIPHFWRCDKVKSLL